MRKRATVTFDSSLALRQGDDSASLAEQFKITSKENLGLSAIVRIASQTEVVLVFKSETTDEEIIRSIASVLEKMMIEDMSAVSVYIDGSELFSGNAEQTGSEVGEESQPDEEMTEDELNKKAVHALIGAEEFKELIEEIRMISGHVIEHNTFEAFTYQSYLFAINDGCGLSTCLNLFAKTLSSCGLFKLNERQPVVEERLLPPGNEKVDPFACVLSHIQGMSRSGRVICVDISEWMTSLSSKKFKEFLMTIEDHSKENIFVFRVPFVEAEVLDIIRDQLNDIVFIRTVPFTPMNSDELVECGKRCLKKFSYSADDDVWEIFRERITEEKSDGRFYGINTVNKTIHEMIYCKQLNDARNNVNTTIISKGDISRFVHKGGFGERDAFVQLGEMVGMDKVKNSIEEILTQIELSKRSEGIATPCLHMRFVGNPGTGKTTVARLVGRILKARGVLRNGNFFEYSGRDLCGRYVGETAPKTAAICRDAYGSVLFIDEAYSLYRGDDSGRDFGKEALETLIAEMENHRNDLVVIMAGYTDDMEKLMRGNAGLESRMPYIIEFPNYSREELYKIMMKMVDGKVEYTKEFSEAAKDYFSSLSEDVLSSKTFSNARFVRNLFERTCAKAGIRQRLDRSEKLVLTREDFFLASSERTFESLVEKKTKRKIGF